MRLIPMIVATTLAMPAFAETPYNGLYFPKGADDWSCKSADLAQDGGAVGVKFDSLMGVENICRLSRPVNVVNMDATLYDATCTAEGTEYSERVMLMKTEDGIAVIRDGSVAEWTTCE